MWVLIEECWAQVAKHRPVAVAVASRLCVMQSMTLADIARMMQLFMTSVITHGQFIIGFTAEDPSDASKPPILTLPPNLPPLLQYPSGTPPPGFQYPPPPPPPQHKRRYPARDDTLTPEMAALSFNSSPPQQSTTSQIVLISHSRACSRLSSFPSCVPFPFPNGCASPCPVSYPGPPRHAKSHK
jgi:hypothetical protein